MMKGGGARGENVQGRLQGPRLRQDPGYHPRMLGLQRAPNTSEAWPKGCAHYAHQFAELMSEHTAWRLRSATNITVVWYL